MPLLLTFIFNTLIVGLVVLLHYEVLSLLSKATFKRHGRHRSNVLFSMFATLTAHVVEIWLFAAGYWLMMKLDGFGYLAGNFDGALLDYVYFSFTTYTSLGYGDIEPLGNIRFLAALEALAGLALITWSASFMFLEMQKSWGKD